ncbi:BRO family protein [Roseomonas sp. CAU 1739]|uniref:BRO-N domain-containing protein n=1 Tax=Roseomonas sp. CAU 1739 TaxID=3140364 RepID=UPI00325B1B54
MRRLDGDEKAKVSATLIQNQGGPDVWALNELGLYTMVLRSNAPSAARFRRWVTGEVLPSIRKDGSYMLGRPEACASGALAIAMSE